MFVCLNFVGFFFFLACCVVLLFNSVQTIGTWEQIPVPVARLVLCLQLSPTGEGSRHTRQRSMETFQAETASDWSTSQVPCLVYFIICHVNNIVSQPSQLPERTTHKPSILFQPEVFHNSLTVCENLVSSYVCLFCSFACCFDYKVFTGNDLLK